MKNNNLLSIFLILIIFVISCKSTEEPVVEKYRVFYSKDDNIPLSKEDMLIVYKRMIEGIKDRSINKILSCYSDSIKYAYDETTKKALCYNGEKELEGKEELASQYGYLFKNKILDNIEFAIIDINESLLSISFINAWESSDHRFEQTIYFVENQGEYNIEKHIIHKQLIRH